MDEWQELVLDGWLGRRRDGQWVAPRCGLSVPRQNGKNAVLEVREVFGMVALGEKFLHTAHEVKTARKAFARLLWFFDNARDFPELAALVREIRRTNGQEAIYLCNGGAAEFIARSKGSGRGYTVDVLVLDEAQELSDDTLAALLPTISAAPLGNPQMIVTGTPPSPAMNGEVFTRMRVAALAGKDGRLCWHEWSAATVDAIEEANPALGGRLGHETIQDERAAMDPVTFARERGGMWDESNAVDRALDPKRWADALEADSAPEFVAAFGVAMSLDRRFTAVGLVGPREDGRIHLGVASHGRSGDWVVARCVQLDANHGPASFAVNGAGPAGSLIEPLRSAGLSVEVVNSGDYARACAWLTDAVRDLTVAHAGPESGSKVDPLTAAVHAAKSRDMGDGLSGFGRRKSDGDISSLEAVAVALHVLPSAVPSDDVTVAFI